MSGTSGPLYRQVTPPELIDLLAAREPLTLLDVRSRPEHEAWSIRGSLNVPLDELDDGLTAIPKDRLVVVHSNEGTRSARAAALLVGQRIPVAELVGGTRRWAAAHDVAELAIGSHRVVQVRRVATGCLSYVVGRDGAALVVDPGAEVSRYEQIAIDHGWRIAEVVATHLHDDHVCGARLLASRTVARLHLPPWIPWAFPFTALGDAAELPWVAAGDDRDDAPEGAGVLLLDDRIAFIGDLEHAEARAVLGARGGDGVVLLPAHYDPRVPLPKGDVVRAPSTGAAPSCALRVSLEAASSMREINVGGAPVDPRRRLQLECPALGPW